MRKIAFLQNEKSIIIIFLRDKHILAKTKKRYFACDSVQEVEI